MRVFVGPYLKLSLAVFHVLACGTSARGQVEQTVLYLRVLVQSARRARFAASVSAGAQEKTRSVYASICVWEGVCA